MPISPVAMRRSKRRAGEWDEGVHSLLYQGNDSPVKITGEREKASTFETKLHFLDIRRQIVWKINPAGSCKIKVCRLDGLLMHRDARYFFANQMGQ